MAVGVGSECPQGKVRYTLILAKSSGSAGVDRSPREPSDVRDHRIGVGQARTRLFGRILGEVAAGIALHEGAPGRVAPDVVVGSGAIVPVVDDTVVIEVGITVVDDDPRAS